MKNRILLVFLVITLAASLVMSGACTTTPPVEAQTITLGFVHFWPATSFQQEKQFAGYFEMVEEATEGKYILNIEWFPAGTLFAPPDIYDGVLNGVVDSGVSVVSYTPGGRLPVTLALSQAGIAPPTSAGANSRTVWEFYNEFKATSHEFEDVKLLYLWGTPTGWIHSTSPIRTLEDIEGKDVRATGASAVAAAALGGNPVSMTQDEVYIEAGKGLLDASLAPIEVLMTYHQGEYFTSSTFVPFCYSEQFYMIMNMDTWNSLPADLQVAFDAVAEDAVKEAGQIWSSNEQVAMDWAKEQPGGHEFLYLTDEEAARWAKLLEPISGQYITVLNDLGFDGEAIVKRAGEIAAESNALEY